MDRTSLLIFTNFYTQTRKLCILVVVSVLLFYALLAYGQPAYADSMPGGNVADPAVRAVDIAQPAVVRIVTTMHARLKVHFPPTTDITFPQSAGGNYTVQLSGTGTFITAQGDILTADHVVNPPQDKSLEQYVDQQAAQDIADYLNKNGQQSTKDQVTQQLGSGQLQSSPTYDTPASVAFLSTYYTGPLTANDFSSLPNGVSIPVDRIEKESAPDQQDTAIIHVLMKDTPSVQLGDSSNVNPQDTLTIIGFPGNADVNSKPNGLLTSSVNQIYVSSIKTAPSGAPLIQVGGNVGHGDSGGPALDSKGNVVGIVSFGTGDGNGGTSFLQASNSARTLITQLSLNTTPGSLQSLWSQSFINYAAAGTPGHWHKASDGFKQVSTRYPDFKAVQPFLNYAQTQAQSESGTVQTQATPSVASGTLKKSTTTSATPAMPPIVAILLTVGLILVLLLLAVLLIGTALRSRKKRVRAATTQAAVSPAGTAQNRAEDYTGTTVQPAVPDLSSNTLTLKAWPCGHMNRSNARFCSICGELAPSAPGTK